MSGGRRATRREAIAIARRIRSLSRGVRRVEARTFSPTFPSGFTIGRSLCVDPATPIFEEGESAPERLASRDRTRRTNRRRSCPGVSFGSVSRIARSNVLAIDPPRVSRAGFALFVHAFFRRQIEKGPEANVGRKVAAPVHLARSECDTPLTTLRTPPDARPPTAPPLHVRRTRYWY